MDTVLCTQCGHKVAPSVATRKETLLVRGESIEVETQVASCPECGEDIFIEELDGETLLRAFAEYRRRNRLLSPEEIKEIRDTYGLAQRPFSLLLGWGEITLHRYESGSLQDLAHDTQLRMVNPDTMHVLVEANGHKLGRRQRRELLNTLRLKEAGLQEELKAKEEELSIRLLAKSVVGEAEEILRQTAVVGVVEQRHAEDGEEEVTCWDVTIPEEVAGRTGADVDAYAELVEGTLTVKVWQVGEATDFELVVSLVGSDELHVFAPVEGEDENELVATFDPGPITELRVDFGARKRG